MNIFLLAVEKYIEQGSICFYKLYVVLFKHSFSIFTANKRMIFFQRHLLVLIDLYQSPQWCLSSPPVLPASGPTYKLTPPSSPHANPLRQSCWGWPISSQQPPRYPPLVQSANARVETLGGALPIRVRCPPLVQSAKARWKHWGIL